MPKTFLQMLLKQIKVFYKKYSPPVWARVFWVLARFDPRKSKTKAHPQLRVSFMATSALIIGFFILIRYAWIAFLPTDLREKTLKTGSRQMETTITLNQPRVTLTDRHGRILAISVSRPSLFLLTKKMPRDEKTLKNISEKLDVPLKTLVEYSQGKKSFVWLKRQMTPEEFRALGSLKRWQEFIGMVDEPKRIYPEKERAAHLVGFVGSEGKGLEGVEKIYDERLNLEPIQVNVSRDAKGSLVITAPSDASKPWDELPVLPLSIDLQLQEITERALANGVENARAKGGSAVVVDVKTGELLAIASYPTYDLNRPPQGDGERRRFRAVMDAMELGSVVKPMWVAKALDLGVIDPQKEIFTENGTMAVPGGVIRDDHPHGWLTPRDIVKFSSNIGTYKIAKAMGRKAFYDAFLQIGFGRSPGTGLPGEWPGRIAEPDSWREMRFANMAFGQGFAISPLQLAHAMSILVGGGQDRGMNLLKVDVESLRTEMGPPLQFITPESSHQAANYLESVVEEDGGTGRRARIPGVLVGGKTGTAQVWSNTDKAYSGRTAVFEGVFPTDDPKFVIVVVIDQTSLRPAYGGVLAGPVFAEIGKQMVSYLNAMNELPFVYHENLYSKKTPPKPAKVMEE